MIDAPLLRKGATESLEWSKDDMIDQARGNAPNYPVVVPGVAVMIRVYDVGRETLYRYSREGEEAR